MSFDSTPLDTSAKSDLRRRFRTYRAGLDAETYGQLSTAIVARTLALPELYQAGTVHTYWPLVERHEIDIRPLIDAILLRGSDIVLPRVDSSEDAPVLKHRPFEGAGHLVPNSWGLLEPSDGPSVDIETLTAVLVPALGADRSGHRLGYGGGYYDAFLAKINVPSICMVFDACLVDTLPREPHDVPVDIVVSEHRTLRAGTVRQGV